MRYYRTFFCKTFGICFFSFKQTLWHKQWKICIYMSRIFKHFIQLVTHIFPQCITVGLYNHTTTYSRVICQLAFHHKFIVPFRIVVSSFCKFFAHVSSCVLYLKSYISLVVQAKKQQWSTSLCHSLVRHTNIHL